MSETTNAGLMPGSRHWITEAGPLISVLVTVVLIGAIVPFTITAVPQLAGADRAYVVQSSSMRPTIRAGAVVFVEERPASAIAEDDVIVFRHGRGAEADLVTHRVVDVVRRDGRRYFRTKGDALENPDPWLVPPGAVVGEVAFAIPYVGYAVAAIDSPLGLVAFVILPSVAIVLDELATLGAALGWDVTGRCPDFNRRVAMKTLMSNADEYFCCHEGDGDGDP